jgi:hypothetical protein
MQARRKISVKLCIRKEFKLMLSRHARKWRVSRSVYDFGFKGVD